MERREGKEQIALTWASRRKGRGAHGRAVQSHEGAAKGYERASEQARVSKVKCDPLYVESRSLKHDATEPALLPDPSCSSPQLLLFSLFRSTLSFCHSIALALPSASTTRLPPLSYPEVRLLQSASRLDRPVVAPSKLKPTDLTGHSSTQLPGFTHCGRGRSIQDRLEVTVHELDDDEGRRFIGIAAVGLIELVHSGECAVAAVTMQAWLGVCRSRSSCLTASRQEGYAALQAVAGGRRTDGEERVSEPCDLFSAFRSSSPATHVVK